MKIEVTNGHEGHWYKNYIGKVFDVELNGSGSGYTLIDTPHNENILIVNPSPSRKEELLRRLRNTGPGMRLGVNGKNSVDVSIATNKDAKSLLSKEW